MAAPPGLPLGTAAVSLGHVEQAGGYTLTIVESVETVSHSDINAFLTIGCQQQSRGTDTSVAPLQVPTLTPRTDTSHRGTLVDINAGIPRSGQFVALVTYTLVGSLTVSTLSIATYLPEKGAFINILTCAAIRRDHVATLTLTGEVADGVDTAAILTQAYFCQALVDVFTVLVDGQPESRMAVTPVMSVGVLTRSIVTRAWLCTTLIYINASVPALSQTVARVT